jgi:hypothetical protein
MPLQPPQIPNRMTRDWTRVSEVRVRRLTAWDMTEALQVHVGIRQNCLLFLLGLAKIWCQKDLSTVIPNMEFYENSWGEIHIISWEQKSFKHQELWPSEHSLGPKTSLYRSRVKN